MVSEQGCLEVSFFPPSATLEFLTLRLSFLPHNLLSKTLDLETLSYLEVEYSPSFAATTTLDRQRTDRPASACFPVAGNLHTRRHAPPEASFTVNADLLVRGFLILVLHHRHRIPTPDHIAGHNPKSGRRLTPHAPPRAHAPVTIFWEFVFSGFLAFFLEFLG